MEPAGRTDKGTSFCLGGPGVLAAYLPGYPETRVWALHHACAVLRHVVL